MSGYGLGDYLQLALSGISTGSIYVLIALGFITIYNVAGVINLAQGEFVMLGAMLAVTFEGQGLPLALAFALSVLCVTIVGLLTERLTIRPARRAPEVSLVIITIGTSIALRGTALLIWGTSSYRLPEFSPGAPLHLWGAVLSRQRLWIMGAAALVLLALYLFFEFTLLGKAVRACAINRTAAETLGINTATMAALAYGFSSKDNDGVFLIYDLGGGTFDVTVIEKNGNQLITLATDGDVQLGGKDWDERLVNYIADQFQKEFHEDPREDRTVMAYLRLTAEEAKKALSRRQSTRVPVSYRGHWGNYEVKRDQFESLTADLLAMTQLTTELVLEEAGITWASVRRVVPTGGSTRMPMVMRMLEQLSRKPVETPIPVDDAVALGASIHAAILEFHDQDRVVEYSAETAAKLGRIQTSDVAAHALGLVVKDHITLEYRNDVIIKKNSRLPASETKTYQTAYADQTAIMLQVVQGDAPDPAADPAELAAWKDRILQVAGNARSVFVAFTNGAGGKSVVNALQLARMLGAGEGGAPAALAARYPLALEAFAPDRAYQRNLFGLDSPRAA